ncbi:MAG: hypothetical protein LBT38_07775 [Deltaproteobacteria bacterium]|nr:hypothetical protein [Deltaproteobacteria bacterium]
MSNWLVFRAFWGQEIGPERLRGQRLTGGQKTHIALGQALAKPKWSAQKGFGHPKGKSC